MIAIIAIRSRAATVQDRINRKSVDTRRVCVALPFSPVLGVYIVYIFSRHFLHFAFPAYAPFPSAQLYSGSGTLTVALFCPQCRPTSWTTIPARTWWWWRGETWLCAAPRPAPRRLTSPGGARTVSQFRPGPGRKVSFNELPANERNSQSGWW